MISQEIKFPLPPREGMKGRGMNTSPRFIESSPSPHPSPIRGCVAIREYGVIPAKAGIQALEILLDFKFLDARLRGHDELRHSLSRERGIFLRLN
jgi:hypothetical protein